MNRTVAVTLFCAFAIAGSEAAAQSPRCAGLSDAKKPVCEAALAAEHTLADLRVKVPASCALAPVGGRVERLLSELPVADGLLSEEFVARTAPVRAGGVEFEQTVLFAGDADVVVLSVEDGAPRDRAVCYAADAERASLTEVAGAIAGAIAEYNKPMLVSGAAQLRKLADTWSWIVTDGFGQFPWERAFNDLTHRKPLSIYHLPKMEWVLLHPGVGVELTRLDDLRESRGQTVLFVEPIGFVRYNFDVRSEKRRYWGASLLVVATDDSPPGIGGLLRYNKYSVGAVRHLRSKDAGGHWAMTATVELLERTQSARRKLQLAKARADTEAGSPR